MIECVLPDWPAPQRVRALTTTRSGGISVGAYASMNLAQHVGDDARHVLANRQRLRAECALPSEPYRLEQVHGTTVVRLGPAADVPVQTQQADAAWTDAHGVVCCVLTADCLPVLLCDTAGTCVGVAHAGWRGLAAGVIEATVQALRAATDAALLGWLGPAISQRAYEVGPEVRAACLAREPAAAEAFEANAHGRWQADLYALARSALERCGVTAVYGGDFCTHRDARRFFSHRREAPCGRMASLIWLQSG